MHVVFTLYTIINRIQRILIFLPLGQSNEAKLRPKLTKNVIFFNDYHYCTRHYWAANTVQSTTSSSNDAVVKRKGGRDSELEMGAKHSALDPQDIKKPKDTTQPTSYSSASVRFSFHQGTPLYNINQDSRLK